MVVLSRAQRGAQAAHRANELLRDPTNGGWPGHAPWFRRDICGLSNAACPVKLRRSRRRWLARFQQTGSYNPTAHGGGRRPRVTVAELSFLYSFKLAYPEATRGECAVYLLETMGRLHTPRRISDAITKMLNMTRKKLEVAASERSDYRVALWHLRPPPVGHAGVPRQEIINIDEAGFYFNVSQRRWGHAIRGNVARARRPMARGLHYNVIAGGSFGSLLNLFDLLR